MGSSLNGCSSSQPKNLSKREANLAWKIEVMNNKIEALRGMNANSEADLEMMTNNPLSFSKEIKAKLLPRFKIP